MQSALRVNFGMLFCCMLRHLLLFVLCMFRPLPGWHLGPPFQPLEALLFEIFGVALVPKITPSYAVWIARWFWHACVLYAASSAVFLCSACFCPYQPGIGQLCYCALSQRSPRKRGALVKAESMDEEERCDFAEEEHYEYEDL